MTEGSVDPCSLWRFYQANRSSMLSLLKHTDRTAVEVGLVNLAVQAIDGTKIAANAARDPTYDAVRLERLLVRTDAAIGDLDDQNESGDDPSLPRLPTGLQQTQALRERIQHAIKLLDETNVLPG